MKPTGAINIPKDAVFGSLFTALGCTLCGYLSVIDIYNIIASGILGDVETNQWTEFFSSDSLFALYTDSESIRSRDQLVKINHRMSQIQSTLGSFSWMNVKLTHYPDTKPFENAIFWSSHLHKTGITALNTISPIKYTEKMQNITKNINISKSNIKPILLYLLLHFKASNDAINDPLAIDLMSTHPAHANLLLDSSIDEYTVEYTQLLRFWSNFDLIFEDKGLPKDILFPDAFILKYQVMHTEHYTPDSEEYDDEGLSDEPEHSWTTQIKIESDIKYNIETFNSFKELLKKLKNTYTEMTIILQNRNQLDPQDRQDGELVGRFMKFAEKDVLETRKEEIKSKSLRRRFRNVTYLKVDIARDLESVLFLPGLTGVNNWYLVEIDKGFERDTDGDMDWWGSTRYLIVGHLDTKDLDADVMDVRLIVWDCIVKEYADNEYD